MSKRDLKKYLKNFDNNGLTKIILDTYSKNKDAKEYLDYLVEPTEKEQFLKAKKIIKNEYFHEQTHLTKARLSVAKKAISDFKRFDPSPELVAELLIFLVEQISDYAKLYGVTDISFYDSIESNYLTALVFIHDNDLLDKFKSRAKKIVDISYDEYFNSILCDLYLGFYLKIE